jgi:colicin import membrane protein
LSTTETTEQPAVIETAIAEYSPTATALAQLVHRYGSIVFDVTTPKGDREARAARLELVKLRTGLEAKRRELKAPALERSRLIDSEATRINAFIAELEQPIDQQIKAEEQRREAEKQAKIDAEHRRIEGNNRRIDEIRTLVVGASGMTSDQVDGVIKSLVALAIDNTFAEFEQQAEATRVETLAKLRDLHAAALRREDEARRIEAERAELEQLRAERERRDAEEAERRRAEAAGVEAAQREERDRLAAERRRLEEERAAALAEQRRLDDVARAERQAADRAARAEREEQDRIAQEARAAEQRRIDEQRAELARREEAARQEREAAAKLKQEKEDERRHAELEAQRRTAAAAGLMRELLQRVLKEVAEREHISEVLFAEIHAVIADTAVENTPQS